jgi:hypothetical protein
METTTLPKCQATISFNRVHGYEEPSVRESFEGSCEEVAQKIASLLPAQPENLGGIHPSIYNPPVNGFEGDVSITFKSPKTEQFTVSMDEGSLKDCSAIVNKFQNYASAGWWQRFNELGEQGATSRFDACEITRHTDTKRG